MCLFQWVKEGRRRGEFDPIFFMFDLGNYITWVWAWGDKVGLEGWVRFSRRVYLVKLF